jgi:membrane protease YdiL (CAAX protease family)
MLPSRYNLIHALAATAVLLAMIFSHGFAAFWQQFAHGIPGELTPSLMLQCFLHTGILFGTLWIVLWASALSQETSARSGPNDTKAPTSRLRAVRIAACWSPLFIAVALGLNWLGAYGIKHFTGIDPSEQELVKFFTNEASPLGYRIGLGILVLIEAPLLEEPLFRGVLFRGFASSLPIWAAMALSSFLFALVHANAASFIALCFLGCVFTWLYRRTGTILAPMTAHALFNATNLALLPFLAP